MPVTIPAWLVRTIRVKDRGSVILCHPDSTSRSFSAEHGESFGAQWFSAIFRRSVIARAIARETNGAFVERT